LELIAETNILKFKVELVHVVRNLCPERQTLVKDEAPPVQGMSWKSTNSHIHTPLGTIQMYLAARQLQVQILHLYAQMHEPVYCSRLLREVNFREFALRVDSYAKKHAALCSIRQHQMSIVICPCMLAYCSTTLLSRRRLLLLLFFFYAKNRGSN
jgi:hypothetical protein